jgi:hypothetical protein
MEISFKYNAKCIVEKYKINIPSWFLQGPTPGYRKKFDTAAANTGVAPDYKSFKWTLILNNCDSRGHPPTGFKYRCTVNNTDTNEANAETTITVKAG